MREVPMRPGRSLASQSSPGRGPEQISKGSVKGRPDVTAPGVRDNQPAVGKMPERSAADYADKMLIK